MGLKRRLVHECRPRPTARTPRPPCLPAAWPRQYHVALPARSRGGRTTKIHALTDACCRPIAFLLTGGQMADCTGADSLLDRPLAAEFPHGDKVRQRRRPPEDREQRGCAPHPAQNQSRLEELFSP